MTRARWFIIALERRLEAQPGGISMLRSIRFPFVVTAAFAVIMGCTTPASNTTEATSTPVTSTDGAIALRFTQNGESSVISATAAELSSAAAKPLANVTHEGQSVLDAAEVLSLDSLSVKLGDGQTLTLVAEGTSLRAEGLSVSWNADHTTLAVSSASGEASIDLSSISDDTLRTQVAGYLALTSIGGQVNQPGAEPAFLVPLLWAGGFVVSVAACLAGNHDCANQAWRGCRPRGVRAQKAICGGGRDVNGAWQWGIHCSFSCN